MFAGIKRLFAGLAESKRRRRAAKEQQRMRAFIEQGRIDDLERAQQMDRLAAMRNPDSGDPPGPQAP